MREVYTATTEGVACSKTSAYETSGISATVAIDWASTLTLSGGFLSANKGVRASSEINERQDVYFIFGYLVRV